MAISIRSVYISPNNLITGQKFTIKISVEDVSWNTVKKDFQNWNELKNDLNNWKSVKNYT